MSKRTARQRLQKGEQKQAIGRSRGGRNTKVHALADARGRLLAILVTGGEAPDCPVAERLIAIGNDALYRQGDELGITMRRRLSAVELCRRLVELRPRNASLGERESATARLTERPSRLPRSLAGKNPRACRSNGQNPDEFRRRARNGNALVNGRCNCACPAGEGRVTVAVGKPRISSSPVRPPRPPEIATVANSTLRTDFISLFSQRRTLSRVF
jgi:hypothetical protein